ncbi:MAG: nucleoside transporter [Alphaproteobacteria bacterium]|nr:nucleoside transporter [Alphaproteobacteria bacterium]
MNGHVVWGWDNARALLGLVVIFAVCWLISENRKAFPWRIVLGATGIQVAFAILFYAVPPVRDALASASVVVDALQGATRAGTNFVFGYVGDNTLWPFKDNAPGPVFFFQILPLVIVVASLSAILWHWRVLRWITKGFAFIFAKTMGIGGATSLAVSANVFMGMTEAPILIKPYLPGMTRSEIFIVLVAGFATIAGSVMVIYVTLLQPVMQNPLSQLLIASLMAAPAAVAIALTIVPESSSTVERAHQPDFEYHSTMDAFATGASDGMKILLNIATMLIAALALLYLVNAMLGALPPIAGAPLSLQRILGWIFAPLMYMIGVPWNEAQKAGSLMGVKTVLTEFVAYIDLSQVPVAEMTDRTRRILANALCGFANFGSIGILMGGMTILAPEKREVFLSLAWKTLLAGTLATCCSGAIIGALPASLYGG